MCDYADVYILVNGTIRAANAVDADTRLTLKNCAPFTKCNLEINDHHVDTAENLDIVMPMYNLIDIQILSRFITYDIININEMNHQLILKMI